MPYASSLQGMTSNEDIKKKKKKTKRSERKGFKQDRFEAYQQKFHKSQYKKDIAQKKNNKPSPKEIIFDPVARKDYLLSLHKKKNERRVAAYLDAKRKAEMERKKFKAEQREEGRRAYNSFAQVPILPNYTLGQARVAAGEEEEEEEEQEAKDTNDDDEYGEKNKNTKILPKHFEKKCVYFSNNVDGVTGGVRHSSSVLDDSGVSVIVTPLRVSTTQTQLTSVTKEPTSIRISSKEAAKASGSTKYKFDNLPAVVAKELAKLREETKGSARTKPRISTLKCLEKIRKIRKYSRKGHGKKSKCGKKKNR